MPKIRMIDVDGTICRTAGRDYENAVPIPKRIQVINSLYDSGDIIIYWTSRGMVSKVNYEHLTRAQLEKWGCKYHELRTDKPVYDVFIDDLALNASVLDI
jgi:hypothetical protein